MSPPHAGRSLFPGSDEDLRERVRKQLMATYQRHATLAAREALLRLHHLGLPNEGKHLQWFLATTHLQARPRTLTEVDPQGRLARSMGLHQVEQWMEQAAGTFFAERLNLPTQQAHSLVAQAVSAELTGQVVDLDAPPQPGRA